MKNAIKWVMIHNIAVIIGFVVLAVIFKHWWIVFFSLLFTHCFRSGRDSKESDE